MENTAGRSRYAWGVVLLLTFAYILSFIDRQVLGLLITPIKTSLRLSDTEIGLLMGPAFAVFYVTLGWPIAWVADRANRRNIIVCGVALWSLMTMVCGFSRTFPQLILARIGVGVGEATLTPSALSMITDYFARETRPRAISFYNNGIYIGSGLAYLVGGAVISSLHEFGSVTLPVIGATENWQTVFMIVGLPGLIVAFAVRFIREPTRAGNDQRASFPDEGSVRYLLTRWRVFGPPCIGLCASTMITYLGGWYAPLFERVWQWPVARIGFWIGVNYLVFGPLGTTIAGWLAERLARRNIVGLPYRLIFAGTAVGGIGATVLPLMPTPELAVVAHAVFVFGGAVASAMGSTTVVTLAPDRLRAQASAIYYLVINLVGLFAGPPLVGLLSDHVFTAPTGIAQAIAVVSLGATLPALLVLWLGVKHYDAELSRIFPTLRGARA